MRRPISVTIVACVYLAVGIGGFATHFSASVTDFSRFDGFWIELTELAALVSGAFLLRRQNWARWLALAWIAFHVIISFGKPGEFAIHCLFCAGIAWALFRSGADLYFRGVHPD